LTVTGSIKIYRGADYAGLSIYGSSSDGVRINLVANDAGAYTGIYGYDDDHGGSPVYTDVRIGSVADYAFTTSSNGTVGHLCYSGSSRIYAASGSIVIVTVPTIASTKPDYALFITASGTVYKTTNAGGGSGSLFLCADGTWKTVTGTANNPGGSDTMVQYNSAGSFAGSSNFVFDTSTYAYDALYLNGRVHIGAASGVINYPLTVTGGSYLNGNLGVGTAPTTYKFEVAGNAYISTYLGIGVAPGAYSLNVNGDSLFSDVGIGGWNGAQQLFVYQSSAVLDTIFAWSLGIGSVLHLKSGGTTTSYLLVEAENSVGTTIAKLYSDGDWWAHDYLLSSDRRLKDIYNPITNGLELVMKLNPVTYRWKDKKDDYIHSGFIAQEVQELFPELVREDRDGFLSLSYGKMSVLAIAGVQNLYYRVETVEEKIERLEKRVKDLENGNC